MINLKYINKAVFIVIIQISLAGLTSCQKVISIDLNSPSPQLVVEASISDKPGPYFVKLSNTVNFDNITEFPMVTGAVVEISDSSGNVETLIEMENGIYRTSTLQGAPGQSYKLTIRTDGRIYESDSFMPYPVEDIRLSITPEVDDRPLIKGNTGPKPKQYQVNFEINDPEKYNNFYRFAVFHKNRQIATRRVFSDQFHNGKIIAGEFGLHDTINFEPGDTVALELQNIDKGTYDFFRTLRDGAGGLTFLSASPSNPISNISNNGLGYFSAYSVKACYAVIPN
jgi:hypothetical protein